MEPRHLIRAAIAVSVIGHLALAVGVFFADARPFEAPPSETMAVDIVTPKEVEEAAAAAKEHEPEKPPEAPKPPDEFRLPELSIQDQAKPQPPAASKPQSAQAAPQDAKPAAKPPAETAQQPPEKQPPEKQQPSQQAAPPPQQAAPAQSTPWLPTGTPPPQQQQRQQRQQPQQQQAALQPQSQPQPEPPAQQQPAVPPQPDADLTVKYGVMLGLPGFGGGETTEQADIPKSAVALFRRHLKSCSKRPGNVALTDDSMVKLRATLSRDGRLTAEPTVLEVRRPAKAALLLQAAKAALESCQPYSMLPADKYDEWKVLDLPFTPQDFEG